RSRAWRAAEGDIHRLDCRTAEFGVAASPVVMGLLRLQAGRPPPWRHDDLVVSLFKQECDLNLAGIPAEGLRLLLARLAGANLRFRPDTFDRLVENSVGIEGRTDLRSQLRCGDGAWNCRDQPV